MKRCITIVIGFLMGCYTCMGAPVVNYLLNADFAEVIESGMPTSWGTRHWGMWYGNFEIWKQGWCMSKDEKLDGAGVFVLDASRIGNNSVELVSCWNGSPMGQAVFSVYLKSEPAGGRVKLGLGETTKEVTVTEQWQRYWMPVETGGIITVSITGFAGHRVSLSKPQLEAGIEPTPFQTRESAGQMAPLHFQAGQNLEFPLLTYSGKEPKLVNDISDVTLILGKDAKLNGAANVKATAGKVNLELGDGAIWNVTADSSVDSLSFAGDTVDDLCKRIVSNGHVIHYREKKGILNGEKISLDNGGMLVYTPAPKVAVQTSDDNQKRGGGRDGRRRPGPPPDGFGGGHRRGGPPPDGFGGGRRRGGTPPDDF